MPMPKAEPDVVRYADMFSAMGTEPRLRIMRALLAAHPEGMIAATVAPSSIYPPRPSRITLTDYGMRIW
jgi:hypothetical protein